MPLKIPNLIPHLFKGTGINLICGNSPDWLEIKTVVVLQNICAVVKQPFMSVLKVIGQTFDWFTTNSVVSQQLLAILTGRGQMCLQISYFLLNNVLITWCCCSQCYTGG